MFCTDEIDVSNCRRGVCMGVTEESGVCFSLKVDGFERRGSMVYVVEGLLQQCFLAYASLFSAVRKWKWFTT